MQMHMHTSESTATFFITKFQQLNHTQTGNESRKKWRDSREFPARFSNVLWRRTKRTRPPQQKNTSRRARSCCKARSCENHLGLRFRVTILLLVRLLLVRRNTSGQTKNTKRGEEKRYIYQQQQQRHAVHPGGRSRGRARPADSSRRQKPRFRHQLNGLNCSRSAE